MAIALMVFIFSRFSTYIWAQKSKELTKQKERGAFELYPFCMSVRSMGER